MRSNTSQNQKPQSFLAHDRLTKSDRKSLELATKSAWTKATEVTEGRVPRFGYRPIKIRAVG